MAGGRVNVACMVMLLAIVVMAATADAEGVVPTGRCCRDYYDQPCVPGKDDQPGGSCYEFCIQECKGPLCKKTSNGHHCHCLC
ncbi:hypothetical protein LINPERPRIM_LOCUS13697 [Linum perenne]